MKELIAKLVAERRRAGVLQGALAARIGVDGPHLCRWEHGTSRPCLENLVAWANALGFDLALTKRGAP